MLILATLLLSNITVTLPAEASVEGSEITLGQIATITGADPEEVARIAAIELGYAPSPGFTRVVQGWKVEAQLETKGVTVTVGDAARSWIAQKGYDPKMGARPLSRKIDELIRVPLSKKILFDRLSECDITAYMDNDAIQFNVQPVSVIPVVSDDGIIR